MGEHLDITTLSPEERKLRIDEERLSIDRQRLSLDQSFAKKWAPVLVAAMIPVLVALGSVAISLSQLRIAARDSELKGIDYYVKALTDPSYTVLPPADRQFLGEALAAFFPDVWGRRLQMAIANNIVAKAPSSTDPAGDTRYQALSALPAGQLQISEPSGLSGLRPASAYTIYLHYKNPADRPRVDALAAKLRGKGYSVPGSQVVAQSTRGDIRYYKPEEQEDAKALKAVAEESLGAATNLALIDISPTFPRLPAGIMEIWIPDLSGAQR